ncbi:MAG: hypothetical protein K8I82_20130 [Anaerolineae bacterium]|nr:hypothetical protein [Anaerolineae bacterium]
MSEQTRTLYRPVGLKEAELILVKGVFPPRPPEEALFYPYLYEAYAEQVARERYIREENKGYAGFVTEFKVRRSYIDKFKERIVGDDIHAEFWIPVIELDELNQNIEGRIEITAAFYGEKYTGQWHRYLSAEELFIVLYRTCQHYNQVCWGEIRQNRHAVLLNYEYWKRHDFGDAMSEEQKLSFLRKIAVIWEKKIPERRLLGSLIL